MVEIRVDGNENAGVRRKRTKFSRAQQYFAISESYAAAVENLIDIADTVFAPFHMMVGHTLELSLKAVLAHAGEDEELLIMSGHNLFHCYKEARAYGFTGSDEESLFSLVAVLDRPHADQRFRYPSLLPGTPHLVAADAANTLRLHLADVSTWLSSKPRRGRQKRQGDIKAEFAAMSSIWARASLTSDDILQGSDDVQGR